MLKPSPAMMETSRPSSLPSHRDRGEIRATRLLTEWVDATRRTQATPTVLIPLIPVFSSLFPKLTIIFILFLLLERDSWSSLSSRHFLFPLSLSWTDCLLDESLSLCSQMWLMLRLMLSSCTLLSLSSGTFRLLINWINQGCLTPPCVTEGHISVIVELSALKYNMGI